MDMLLAAIVDDDREKVRKLLKADRALVTRFVEEPKLYRSKIFHWIYAGDTALHLAAAGYRVEIVRALLAAGADPNAAGNHRQSTPLHYAADGFVSGPVWDAKRQVKTIEVLLEAGARINAQDKNGASALHRAVRTRCAAAVRFLLQAGANARLKNKPGSTPFTWPYRTPAAAAAAPKLPGLDSARSSRSFSLWASAPGSKMARANPSSIVRGAVG